jgi:seryl-tRNA synthetase
LQEAQAARNAASKEIGQAMAAKDAKRAEALKEDVARLKTEIQDSEAAEREVEKPTRICSPIFPTCRRRTCRSA